MIYKLGDLDLTYITRALDDARRQGRLDNRVEQIVSDLLRVCISQDEKIRRLQSTIEKSCETVEEIITHVNDRIEQSRGKIDKGDAI